MNPQMPPYNRSAHKVIDFGHVLFQRVKCAFVVSDLGIGMTVMVYDNGLHRTFEIEFNCVHFLLFCDDNILYLMWFEILVVEHSIDFMASKNILASEVTRLLNRKAFD